MKSRKKVETVLLTRNLALEHRKQNKSTYLHSTLNKPVTYLMIVKLYYHLNKKQHQNSGSIINM